MKSPLESHLCKLQNFKKAAKMATAAFVAIKVISQELDVVET